MTLLRWRLWAVTLAAGCASSPPPSAAPPPTAAPAGDDSWLTGHYPDDLSPSRHRLAVASHPDPIEATLRARLLLERAVFGATQLRPFAELPEPLHTLLAGAEIRTQQRFETVEVLAAVLADAVPEALARWRAASPPAPMILRGTHGAAQIAAAQANLQQARQDAFACKHGGIRCETSAVAEATSTLAAMASRIELSPLLSDGVPYRRGGPALRPARLRAVWRTEDGDGLIWPGLPLQCDAGTSPHSLKTDATGVARHELREPPTDSTEVRCWLDRAALLGADAEIWPRRRIGVRFRALQGKTNRVATKIVAPSPTMQIGTALQALADGLGNRGFAQPAALGATVTSTAAVDPGHDVLVVGEIRTFADGRPTDYTFCYRARATLTVIDAWGGAPLAELDRDESACEIGADNASRAALTALGEALAAAVAAILGAGE